MRKVFWCAAAGLVAAAVGVYHIADYAAKHPNSAWARCLNGAAGLGLYANPFVPAVSTAASQVVCEAARQASGAACNGVKPVGEGATPGAVARLLENELVPGNEQEFNAPPCLPNEEVAPFEPIQVEPMPCEPVKEDGENWVFDGLNIPRSFPNETEEPRVGTTEESEPVCEQQAEPVRMPYADEGEQQECPAGRGENWFWKLLRLGGLVRANCADDAELLAMPTACEEDAEEQGVESEATRPTPDCQEDPAYHHHYHGCPYMGGCPYPHSRAVPVITPLEREQPTPEQAPEQAPVRKTKKKPTTESGCGVKKVFWYSLDEEEATQSGIDTMEFRPTDDPREWPGNGVPF